MTENKIDLMVVGAQKCGTTSLKNYLGQHPDICAHNTDEIDFFLNEELYKLGFSSTFENYFDPLRFRKAKARIGKSVSIMCSPIFLERLKSHNPDVFVVIVLRNPIDRAYSSYWYARRKGWENNLEFSDAILETRERFREGSVEYRNCAYIENSIYVDQLMNTYKIFNESKIKIIQFEDLKSKPLQVCQEIFSKLNVAADYVPEIEKVHNTSALPRSPLITKLLYKKKTKLSFLKNFVSARKLSHIKDKISNLNEKKIVKPKLGNDERQALVDFFVPHNKRLSEFLKKDLSYWNK